MADLEASVRDLLNRDRDCTSEALAQLGLRRRINLLIEEWKAAGGGDVLPDVADRMRLRSANSRADQSRSAHSRSAKTDGKSVRAIARR